MPSKSLKHLKFLFTYFSKFGEVSPGIQNMIFSESSSKQFARGNIFDCNENENPNIYFIVRGSVRGFVEVDTRDITTWFSIENSIVGLTNIVNKVESERRHYIQALEKTEVIIIPYKLIMSLFTQHHPMFMIGRNLLWHHYMELDERNILARLPTAEKRFKRLLETHPYILDRIALKYLSSFLCMRLETLSRIKTKLSKATVKNIPEKTN